MISDKKGLSAIVGTLLIILLVIVAVGIIWVVIRGTLEGGAEQLELGSKCLDVSVRVTAADCTAGDSCNITVQREAGGDAFDGIKYVLSDGSNSVSSNVDGNLGDLEISTQTISETLANNVSSVEVAVYFKNSAGEPQICSNTHTFTDIKLV